MEQNNLQQEMSNNQLSAAELLRTTREGIGMSREEVAADLRLQVKLITALEENNRAQLPPAAFISGYLRAYAKLLGLAPEPLINSYLDAGVTPSDYRATDRSGESMASSSDPKYQLITVGVVVGLLILFTIWWANERYAFVSTLYTTQQEADSAELQSASALAPSEESVALQGEGALSMSPLPHEIAAAERGDAAAVSVAPQQSPVSATPAPVAVTLPPQIVAPPAASAPVAAATAATTVPISPSSALMAISEPLPPTTPQARVRLEFQAECWTQVTDAQGRTLAYQLMSPGRRLELRGVAPFKVFLGYAPGVLVYYNGSLFSHSSYQRGDVAKFNMGSVGDNRPLDR